MNASDLKAFVQKVAPTVAAALGGPLAGVAVSALSNIILGHPDGTPDQIDSAIASGQLTGEQMVALKKLDVDFKTHESEMGFKYADLEFQTTQAFLADVDSARKRQMELKDNIPQIILACAAMVYVFQFSIFIFWHLPTDEFVRALIVRGFGTIDGVLLTCVAYFVGSSRGSKSARDSLARIAEAPVPTPIVNIAQPVTDGDK